MPSLSRTALEEIFCEVEKPVRYIGSEWNSVVRDGDDVDFRVALAYPDQYEIGMSHLGFRILYSLLNRKDGVAAERVFAPWPDFAEALSARRVPLHSLETKRPLSEFDVLGFSLQYEMTLTNVLLMLDLAGIPLVATERRDGHPLVIAGGPVAMAPEGFADIFDLIAIGDGEELFPELIDRCRELRDGGADRLTMVSELGRIPGVYAPRFYEREPDPATGLEIVVGSATHPFPIKRRILMDIGRYPFPQDIIVPYCEIVHARVAVEIMRGCNVGCRFCQAGYIYRPERIRTPDQVVHTAVASADRTGFDEVSLTSLNTGEYPQVENVVMRLMDRFEESTTAVSLPSLRASSLTGGLLDEIGRVRKSGLTIAPEGGTQRMRDVINKNISEADITSAAEAAYGHGWDLIKLYFMIGQPTERDEDVTGIAETALRVLRIGKSHRGGRAKVNLGVSSFIPKSFTPFQWHAMDSPAELHRKQDLIARTLGKGAVKFGRHDVEQSIVESALSRADRRAGRAILRAFREGARFDGWSEFFSAERWRSAFAAEGLSMDEYAHRAFDVDGALPWDHVDIGVRKSYLAAEWDRARSATVVSICSGSDCHGCGSFVKECLAGNVSHGREFPKRGPRAPREPKPVRRPFTWRAEHAKAGWLRFISHLDLQRTLRYAFRRAGIDLAHSEGFHPLPKITFAPALPLGVEGRRELFDFTVLADFGADELLHRVNAQLPDGLRVSSLRRVEGGMPRLSRCVNAGEYAVSLTEDDIGDIDLDAAVSEFLSRESLPIMRKHQGGVRPSDIRRGVLDLQVEAGLILRATLRVVGDGNARADDLMRALLGRPVPRARIVRERLLLERDGALLDPLALPEVVTAA